MRFKRFEFFELSVGEEWNCIFSWQKERKLRSVRKSGPCPPSLRNCWTPGHHPVLRMRPGKLFANAWKRWRIPFPLMLLEVVTQLLEPRGSPTLMLAGHIDELGLIIKHVSDKGFLYFDAIGGHDRSIISGRRVDILTKNGVIRGVTGKSGHPSHDS